MKKTEYRIFPTLVLRFDQFISQEQASDIFQYCKQLPVKGMGAFRGDAVSSYDVNQYSNLLGQIVEDVSSCKDLYDRLVEVLKEFSRNYGLLDTYPSNSWFNMQNAGSVLEEHAHPGSIISGCLYINVDSNSSKTFFHNPNYFLKYYRSDYRGEDCSYDFYSFKPEVGSLLLWPSWLVHGSNRQANFTNERMVVSFNSYYR